MARPKTTSLLTLDEAIKILNKVYHWDESARGKPIYSKQTIYNAIYKGKLTRHGPKHRLLIDKSELLERFGKNVA